MIRFRHKKTGKFYALLAHGVDATNSRAGTPVVVYSPEDDPHAIYIREREEFYQKFEEFKDRPPCYECGNPSIHDHHVIPRSLGGTKTIPLCGKCHGIVHANPSIVNINKLTKMALKEKKARGERIGAIEYGYSLAEDGIHLEINEYEQDVIKLVQDYYATGMSMRAVCDKLDEFNIKTRNGKKFQPGQIHLILKKRAA